MLFAGVCFLAAFAFGAGRGAKNLTGSFFDDFSSYPEGSTAKDNWSQTGNVFVVHNGQFVWDGGKTDDWANPSPLVTTSKNFEMEFDYTRLPRTTRTFDACYLYFRHKSDSKGAYSVSWAGVEGGVARVGWYVRGTNTEKSEGMDVLFPVDYLHTYRIHIRAIDGLVRLYIDNVLLIEEASIDPGAILAGDFIVASTAAQIDNVSLQLLP